MARIEWVTVLEASRVKVDVVRGVLDSEGIATFVPDELTKLADPFITGGNAFTVRLQVPAADVERARALIAQAPMPPEPAEAAADEREEQEERAEQEESDAAYKDPVERNAERTIFSAALVVTFPLALLFGTLYLVAWRVHGHRARLHGLVLAVFFASLALTIVLAVGLLRPPAEEEHDPLRPRRPPRAPVNTFPLGR
jgi:hypothetical protein